MFGGFLRRLLLFLLLLTGVARAGTNILDANGNVVFTDVQSLNVATATSGDQNQVTLRGQTTVSVQVTAASSVTLQFEGTVATGTYFSVPCVVPTTGAIVTSTTTTGIWSCDVAGLNLFRVRQSTTGSSTSSIIASQGESVTAIDAPLPVGTNLIGAVNVNQFGGSVVVTGTGAGGAGIPRVTVSNDSQVRVLGNAGGAVDAAVAATAPANVIAEAGVGFNNVMVPAHYCDKQAAFTTLGTTATVQQIALVAGQKIWVCGWYALISTATTGINIKWVRGTGSNCGTGTADVTPLIFTTPTSAPAIANWTQAPFAGGVGTALVDTVGNALCITQSSTANSTTLSGVIYYTQAP